MSLVSAFPSSGPINGGTVTGKPSADRDTASTCAWTPRRPAGCRPASRNPAALARISDHGKPR
jgi:hypothetical protein